MGGKRIDDHSFWAGSHGHNTVMPDGAKTKRDTTAESAGKLGLYEGVDEQIKRQQDMASSDVHKHGRKDLHRN